MAPYPTNIQHSWIGVKVKIGPQNSDSAIFCPNTMASISPMKPRMDTSPIRPGLIQRV